MSWRQIDETDLAAVLSQGEIDAFRRDAALDGSDPVERLLADVSAMARGYVATNGNIRLAPEALSLPRALVVSVAEIAAYKILKRLDVVPNEARKAAYDEAMEMLKDIAAGKLAVESYGAEESSATGGPAVAIVTASRPRATPGKLEGF